MIEGESLVSVEVDGTLRTLGFGMACDVEPLSGGCNARTVRLRTTSARTAVLKEGAFGHRELWEAEARGLTDLRAASLPTPDVLAVGENFLLLEDCPGEVPDDGPFWDAVAERLAELHSVQGDAFGYHYDNYLGALPQRNPWTSDGREFYAAHRLLRFLEVPLCDQTLGSAGCSRLERLCERLPDLIPEESPTLLHGDLWRNNIVTTVAGEPAFIDPAPYYSWPEVDLSMLLCCGTVLGVGPVPERFLDAYTAVRPLEPGLSDRLQLLFLRELLSGIAHFGAGAGRLTLDAINDTTRRFA